MTHDNVVRHLKEGQALIADRIGYGNGYDGKDNSVWLHVVDPDNNECGWVNSHYLEIVGDDAPPGTTTTRSGDSQTIPIVSAAKKPVTSAAPDSAMDCAHDTPPDAVAEEPTLLTNTRRKYGNDIQLAANLAQILAMLLMLFNMRQGVPPAAAAPPPATTIARVNPPSSANDDTTTSNPHFIYGVSNGVAYRIPLEK